MSTEEPERPVHHVHDCSTGATTITAMTDAEWKAHQQLEQDTEQQAAAQAEQDKMLAEQVAAHPDPLVRLLAQKAGLA